MPFTMQVSAMNVHKAELRCDFAESSGKRMVRS
jgi:hypothetical protein